MNRIKEGEKCVVRYKGYTITVHRTVKGHGALWPGSCIESGKAVATGPGIPNMVSRARTYKDTNLTTRAGNNLQKH